MYTTKVGKLTIQGFSHTEIKSLYREIFSEQQYDMGDLPDNPTIIDIGAYIGISTIFLARRYPDAKIIAVEPSEIAIPHLKENLFINSVDNVDILQVAISPESRPKVYFYIDNSSQNWHSTDGFLKGTWKGKRKYRRMNVKAMKLSELLQQHETVDLLKLDIEGVEQKILKEARKELHRVNNIIVEFHPIKEQSLKKVSHFLEDNGFKLEYIEDDSKEGSSKGIPLTTIYARHRLRNKK